MFIYFLIFLGWYTNKYTLNLPISNKFFLEYFCFINNSLRFLSRYLSVEMFLVSFWNIIVREISGNVLCIISIILNKININLNKVINVRLSELYFSKWKRLPISWDSFSFWSNLQTITWNLSVLYLLRNTILKLNYILFSKGIPAILRLCSHFGNLQTGHKEIHGRIVKA